MDIGNPIEVIDVYGDGQPPKAGTSKYFLIVLAIFFGIFIFYIAHGLYTRQTRSLVTFMLPQEVELYYQDTLLQGLVQPDDHIVVYSCRLSYGPHEFTAVDAEGKEYPLRVEIKEGDILSRSFIFDNGSFIRF